MAWSLPRTLRRLGADLVHTQYAAPLRCPCPFVVTVHDVSFARDPDFMSWKDRTIFRRVVPRAVRNAARVLTVSERTKADIVELYGVPAQRIVVTPNGVDPVFGPGIGDARLRPVGGSDPATEEPARGCGGREGCRAPARRRRAGEGSRARGRSCASTAPGSRATSTTERLAELYRGAACLVQSSRYEGFGLPVLEAMASGTPVVAVPDPALREVAGDAAIFVEEAELADGIRRALAERDRLVAAGLERARAFSWRAAAERTLAVYREILGT